MKFLLLFIPILLTLHAQNFDEDTLKKQIGRMLVVGFNDKSLDENSRIAREIRKYELGGVILFDRFYNDKNRTKNISSPQQLRELTAKLHSFSKKPLFVCIDQEGGRVARLKPQYGFTKIPSAKKISLMESADVQNIYAAQAKMLRQNGINCNFAPVLDLALNPKNKVIVGLERSFSESSLQVLKYAKILIEAQRAQHVISVLKHFPGHGSSLGDSHQGFVDVSKSWNEKELEPYQELIDSQDADMIMTAHVFNSRLDKTYPATLSYKVNTELLRKKMGFRGVVISDDLQMKAISEHFTLKETLTLAINSGVDMLLFGNQLASQSVDVLIDMIYSQVKSKKIPHARILEANRRIENLHTKNSIVSRAIKFEEERIAMTKEYIKQHYGLSVADIKIKPKIIVLHWTAVMDFEKSFKRLYPQTLYSDRADIANAGALNVSAHFLIKRNGEIIRLMPSDHMARHVIGLNYSSIGIENVGGENNTEDDLTPAQLQANIALVHYLKAQYPDIQYLIGHHEYTKMQDTPLWLEKDASYRTKKADPGDRFMREIRASLQELGLKRP
ncbi:N-acetylmuramoyl-L-alanine amidase [bacterium]|nr:N-acetylmuramoyl-L-alanine amidase [bacterium]MBU1990580.1 N-acetylmuramoyl-L-alanine amidase [bacterium]